jgi:hypothetical protein
VSSSMSAARGNHKDGVHSSNAMIISAPMVRWISITFSGVKSGTNRQYAIWTSPLLPWFSVSRKEYTWYPPESVKILRSQFMNLYHRLSPGSPFVGVNINDRCFPNNIWIYIFFQFPLMYPFTEATVPTGIKLVFQSWSVVMLPALALDCGSFFNKSNFIIPFFYRLFGGQR